MPVNTAKRREHIIDLLCEHGSVRVEQLSKQFAVSTVTIRNDLRFLERKGCALRAYGGAMLNQQFAFDRPLHDKGRLNRDVKSQIACRAASYVRDGDALILDSGSTTAQIVPWLKPRRDLVVMTNALNIAYELSGYDGVEVMVLGEASGRTPIRSMARLPSSNCASTASTNCFWASTVSIWLRGSLRLTPVRHTSIV